MNTRGLGTALMVVAVILAVWAFGAPLRAQDHHHPLHKDFYQKWMRPGTNISCCQARVEKDGVETGDCEPTDAKIIDGNWWAYLRQENRYIQIPDAKIIRERNPNVTDAHLCWSYGMVHCFVPPDTGG